MLGKPLHVGSSLERNDFIGKKMTTLKIYLYDAKEVSLATSLTTSINSYTYRRYNFSSQKLNVNSPK